MKFLMVVTVVVFGCLIKFAVTETKYCGRGEYLEPNPKTSESSCQPCPDGTFEDDPKHTNIECKTCRRADYLLFETIARNCTKTEDTVVECVKHRYRNNNTGDRTYAYCQRCQPCGKYGKTKDLPVVLKPCDDFHDTVCGTSLEKTASSQVLDGATTHQPNWIVFASLPMLIFGFI